MRARAALVTSSLAMLSASTHALADDGAATAADARNLEISVASGAALPLGSSESGTRTRDTTFGLVPIALGAAYRASRVVGVALGVRYGIAVPTLCTDSSSCKSSLGSDVALSLRARIYLPRFASASPHVDAGLGWEWLTTRLEDNGASSSRSFSGPLLLTASLASPFALGSRWSLGPLIACELGAFTSSTVEGPGIRSSGAVPSRALHAWLTAGAEVAVRF